MRNNMIVHFMDYRGQFFADINCADCIYTVCAVFYVMLMLCYRKLLRNVPIT